MKTIEIKLDTADIPTPKKFALIPQLLDKGALDWFQENKAKFNNSWSIFVEHFKRTFDSPNRARIGMQKLNSYIQSPYQDIRSFCSKMRKLFLEADPQMSSTMKLEFLLAKVNSSYRLDLLKLKPKGPTEFETMARDIENIYLVNEAIEQNTQINTSFSSSPSVLPSGSPHHVHRIINNRFAITIILVIIGPPVRLDTTHRSPTKLIIRHNLLPELHLDRIERLRTHILIISSQVILPILATRIIKIFSTINLLRQHSNLNYNHRFPHLLFHHLCHLRLQLLHYSPNWLNFLHQRLPSFANGVLIQVIQLGIVLFKDGTSEGWSCLQYFILSTIQTFFTLCKINC